MSLAARMEDWPLADSRGLGVAVTEVGKDVARLSTKIVSRLAFARAKMEVLNVYSYMKLRDKVTTDKFALHGNDMKAPSRRGSDLCTMFLNMLRVSFSKSNWNLPVPNLQIFSTEATGTSHHTPASGPLVVPSLQSDKCALGLKIIQHHLPPPFGPLTPSLCSDRRFGRRRWA